MKHHKFNISEESFLQGMKSRSTGKGGKKAKLTKEQTQGSLKQLITPYLQNLEVHHYSSNTIKSKKEDLDIFIEWCELRELINPESITKLHLESYQRHLFRWRKDNDMPLSISTQRQRLGTVKDYFKWLTKHNHILANPASELELPKKQKRLPEQALSLSQVQSILHVPDVSTLLGMRNRTILEIFYSTGIRRAELTNLSISDINQEKHIVFIRQGKGNKDRVVPIGKTALYWLNQYLDKARDKLALHHEETTLFLSGYGQPITAQAMTSLIGQIIKKADIGRTGSCHLLRHSCATHMLEGGADIRFIQQLLGHESLDTTAIYTQVSIEQLKAVHAKCHPLESK